MLSSVDLPLPDGPMIATESPGRDLQADVVDGGVAAVVVALRGFAEAIRVSMRGTVRAGGTAPASAAG